MRVTICVVGRLRAGPERELVQDYLTRFDRTGRTLGLGPATVAEVEAKAGGRTAESALLSRAQAFEFKHQTAHFRIFLHALSCAWQMTR